MATANHAKSQGYKQGVRERELAAPMKACPYQQRPGRSLLLYQFWISGWYLGRGFGSNTKE